MLLNRASTLSKRTVNDWTVVSISDSFSLSFCETCCVTSLFTQYSPLRMNAARRQEEREQNLYTKMPICYQKRLFGNNELHHVQRRGVLRFLRVVVKAAARFAAVQSRQHHTLQKRRRRKA